MPTSNHAFADYLAQNIARINAYVLAKTPAPTGKGAQEDDLNRYLFDPVRRFVASGGKRTRPALCLLGAEAVGSPAEVALPVAAAVELFQAAALIHDDIADRSELRRGQPCLHISEGTGVAINAGDAALVEVTGVIAQNDNLAPEVRLALIDELCAMQRQTLEGQALDLGWARDGRWDISVEDYLYMARHKTAYYSAATPLATGALCGGGSEAQVEGLRSFGIRCGLAFQIQDDLLNLVGDARAQGKDFRSDITEGKRTLVVVYALSQLKGADRAKLIDLLSHGTTDPQLLAEAVELLDKAGALAYARSYAQQLVAEAKECLDGMDIAKTAAAVLRSMADFFVERTS